VVGCLFLVLRMGPLWPRDFGFLGGLRFFTSIHFPISGFVFSAEVISARPLWCALCSSPGVSEAISLSIEVAPPI
jgi:hypothetical protein